MKALFSFLVISIFLISCSNSEAPDASFKRQPPDTTLTTVQYAHNWAYNDYRTVTAQKIVLDTFTLVPVDTITQMKKWTRDSIYLIQIIDTARNEKGIVRDSLGRPKMEAKVMVLPRQFILEDYNKKWGTK